MTMKSLFNHYVSKLDLTLPQYEAVCALANSLFEDAASTAKHKTKKAIRNALPQYNNKLDDIAKEGGRPVLTERGDTQTFLEYFENNVRATFFHDGKTNIKFEPGAARIAYGELGMQANEDTRKLDLLGKILQEISVAHEAEYDANLNGMTFDELNERFGESIHKAYVETQEKLKNKTYDKSDYIIEWIPDFKTAQQYRKYTDHGNISECWCLTNTESSWNRYTGSHSENKVYFCHVPNFESVPRETGPNVPLDEYGLSLISVIVTPENTLRAVTCRWNHINGGSDGVMNEEQLSNLLGGYVFDLCPPYSREEVIKRGYIYLDEVQQMLDDGVDLSKYVFDDGRIALNDKVNILRGRKLLCDQWFDWVACFSNGLAAVELNKKYNLINTEGNLLSDQWFDWTASFSNGLAAVELNKKYNFIDTEGNIRFKQWFDYIDIMKGFAKVELNGKFNYINTEGHILSDQWFDGATKFLNGFSEVKLNGKRNFIDTEGHILSDQWFDWASEFENGFAKVSLNRKYNYIDTEGHILSDQWFDGVAHFSNGFALVELNRKFNYINTEGNLLSDQWFDWIDVFVNGFARVQLNEKNNFIDTEGKLLSEQWFDWTDNFYDEFAEVELNGETGFIDTEGNIRWE